MTSQLDISFGRTLTERAIKKAVDHADRETNGWSEQAYRILEIYVSIYGERKFMSEDVQKFAVKSGLPAPTEKRAWGGIFQKASFRGLIERVGYQAVSSSVAHMRPGSVWRKKVNH